MLNNKGNVNDVVDLNSLISYEQLTEIIVGSVSENTNLVRIINNDGVEETVQIKYVTEFPPGYHFIPTGEDLIIRYLKEKINGRNIPYGNIPEVQLYMYNPQELTEKYHPGGEDKWLFFSPRDRKYPNGTRPNRAAGKGAGSGYWSPTGADKKVKNKEDTSDIGYRRTLVFYQGKYPRGAKTNWIMNEYRLDGANHKRKDIKDMKLDDWVLCQIHKKADKPARNRGRAPDIQEKPAVKTSPGADNTNNLGDVDFEVNETVGGGHYKKADKEADKKAHKPARNRGRPSRIQEPPVETSPVADTTNNLGDIDYQVNETVGGGGHYPQAFSNGPHMVDISFQNLRFRSIFPGQTSSTTMIPNQMIPMYDPTVFKQESSHNVGYYNHFAQPTYSGFLSLDHNVGQSSMKPYGIQQESPNNFGQSSDSQHMDPVESTLVGIQRKAMNVNIISKRCRK